MPSDFIAKNRSRVEFLVGANDKTVKYREWAETFYSSYKQT